LPTSSSRIDGDLYLDASALVKRYAVIGSDVVLATFDRELWRAAATAGIEGLAGGRPYRRVPVTSVRMRNSVLPAVM